MHEIAVCCFDDVSWSGVEGCLADVSMCMCSDLLFYSLVSASLATLDGGTLRASLGNGIIVGISIPNRAQQFFL